MFEISGSFGLVIIEEGWKMLEGFVSNFMINL